MCVHLVLFFLPCEYLNFLPCEYFNLSEISKDRLAYCLSPVFAALQLYSVYYSVCKNMAKYHVGEKFDEKRGKCIFFP